MEILNVLHFQLDPKFKTQTNGCIALTNEDMREFRSIVFQNTPIEIRK
ncbi:L,D-transpeptidase [Pedobacter sp.]